MPTIKETIQFMNNLLISAKISGYKPLTDEAMDVIEENFKRSKVASYAIRIEQCKRMAFGNYGANIPYEIPVTANSLTPFFINYRFVHEENPQQYDSANKAIISKLSDPNLSDAEKKKIFDLKFQSLLTVDFSRILTGSEAERLDYLSTIVNDAISFAKVPELLEQYKTIPFHNPKTVEALEEKLGFFKAAADFVEYTSIYYQPTSEISEKLTPEQMENIANSEYIKSIQNSNNYSSEEKESAKEIVDAIKMRNKKAKDVADLFALENVFQKLKEQRIIDSRDDSATYVAFDENNKRLDMYEAAKLMKEGKNITFKERSIESLEYILGRTGKAPEVEFTGRSIEFSGTNLKKVINQPNPVLSTLPQLNPEEEMQAAKVWFNDMLANIQEKGGIDPNNKYDTFRLKKVDIGGNWRSEVTQNEYIGMEQPKDPMNFDLEASVALKDFSDEQKLETFRMAREGRLILNALNMFVLDAKGLYVDRNGKFGVTAKLGSLTTDNRQLDISIKEDEHFLENAIPNADNAYQLAQQLGDFNRAVNNDIGLNSRENEDVRNDKTAYKAYESTLLKDIAENPQFYADPETRNARAQLVSQYVKGVMSEAIPTWIDFKEVPEQHDPTAYRGIVQSISTLLNNPENPDEAVKQLASMGQITTGKNRDIPFMNQPGDKPWDLVDRINSTIGTNDEPVYLTIPGEGRIKEYKMSYSGDALKIKEVIPFKKLDSARAEIERLKARLNRTGTTRGDSEEFKKLSTFLNSKIFDPIPETKSDFNNAMKKLASLASDYSFAKLDQSQNDRRRERFEVAFKLQNIADSLLYDKEPMNDREISQAIIAAKAAKSFLTDMAKSKDPRLSKIAAGTLKNRTAFTEQYLNIIKSGTFKNRYDSLSPEETLEKSRSSASTLSKEIMDAQANFKHDFIGKALENIELDNFSNGALTPVSNSYVSGLKIIFPDINDTNLGNQKIIFSKINGNPYNIDASRQGLTTLAICAIIKKGHSIEEAFNPELFQDEKILAYLDVVKMASNKTPENTKKMAELLKVGSEAGLEYFNKKMANIDVTNPAWIAEGDNWKLCTNATFLQSVLQNVDATAKAGVRDALIQSLSSPGMNDGEEKLEEIAEKQVQTNNFIEKTLKSTTHAYRLENGYNDLSSPHTHVEPGELQDSFVNSRFYRESYLKMKAQNPKMKPTEIISGINMRGMGDAISNLNLDYEIAAEIDKQQNKVLSDPGKARAIGQAFLDGKFDKTYTITNEPGKPIAFSGFTEAMENIKPVKLPPEVEQRERAAQQQKKQKEIVQIL